MQTVNRAFGSTKKICEVSKDEQLLHDNIEYFTNDLRVELGVMRHLMSRSSTATTSHYNNNAKDDEYYCATTHDTDNETINGPTLTYPYDA